MAAININIYEVPTVCQAMDFQDLANSSCCTKLLGRWFLTAQSWHPEGDQGQWRHRCGGGGGFGGGRCQLASRYLHQLPKAPNKCNPKKSVCLLSKAVSKEVVYPLLTRMFKLFSFWVETSRYWLLALGRKELGFLLGSPHWTGPPQVSFVWQVLT